MVRRLIFAALILFGVALIITGTQRWLERREVAGTVHTLMTALKKGDRQSLLSLLPPNHPELVGHPEERQPPEFWSPDPDFTYEIHDISIVGSRATAIVRILRDGFQIKPSIHLVKSKTAQWKLSSIKDLATDPRWQDLKRAQSRDNGKETAEELEELFKGQPGIKIERVHDIDTSDIQ